MVEEKKYEKNEDPFKTFLKESLQWKRNMMIEYLSHILQQLPTRNKSSSGSHSRDATPFKMQVNFDIPILEGQIDGDTINRWLNLLEINVLVHDFSNQGNITFALLKVAPNVKD